MSAVSIPLEGDLHFIFLFIMLNINDVDILFQIFSVKINKYISFVCHLTKCYFLISCSWKKICTCRVFLDGNTPANNFLKIKLLLLGKLLSCGRDMSEDKLVLGCERGKLVLYDQHRKASRPAKSSLVCTTSKMYNTIVLSLWQKILIVYP